MTTPSLIDLLREALPDAALAEAASTDMPTAYVDREHLLALCRTLRDHPSLQFALLVDVTAVDYLPVHPRFELVYHLACLGAAYATSAPAAPARRLRVKVRVSGDDPHVPSVTGVYPAANWLEREVFDLFGVLFDGHPDLRRLLLPDDWQGFPLRKDAPVQIRKGTDASEPLQMSAAEFAENIRAAREHSQRQARDAAHDGRETGRRD